MRIWLVLLVAFAAGAAAAEAPAPVPPEIAGYLAGNWAIVDEKEKSSCAFPTGHGEQMGFEFARSGGRALFYEPPDLFTVLGGLEASESGEVIEVSARTRPGERKPLLRLRRKGPDRLEALFAQGKPQTWKRCPPTPALPSEGVAADELLLLSPSRSGGQGFPQIFDGEDRDALCRGEIKDDFEKERGWLQFELIGPSSHWMIIDGMPGAGFFHRVVGVSRAGADSLRVKLKPLDPEVNLGALTVRIGPDHLDVPEISAKFARCAPDQPGSLGMRRLS